MSYKDFVAVKFTADKKEFSVGEIITGELEVSNNSPVILKIESIQVKLILKHQGKGETDSVLYDTQVIKSIKTLDVGGASKLKINLAGVATVSYNGYNVTQSILVSTKVDIAKDTERLLKKEKLSNFKLGGYLSGVFRPDFYNDTPVIITRSLANYSFHKAVGIIKPGIKTAVITLVLGLIISVIIGVISRNMLDNNMILYGILVGYTILFSIVYYLKIGPYLAIGSIDFELRNLEGDLYEIELSLKKRTHIIQEVSCSLNAKELVTYNNGSNRSTATHTFYKSSITKIKSRGRKMRAEGVLPSQSLPISIKNNDFEIRWIFHLEVRTKANLKLKGNAKIELVYDSFSNELEH